MTVGELREKLNEYDDNLELFCSDGHYYEEEHSKIKKITIDKYNNLWLVEGDTVRIESVNNG